jgi:hypothetical protein
MNVVLPLHVLATVIWLGGLFLLSVVFQPSLGQSDSATALSRWHRTLSIFKNDEFSTFCEKFWKQDLNKPFYKITEAKGGQVAVASKLAYQVSVRSLFTISFL